MTARMRDERGFTLAMAMGIMLISSIVCIAAFTAANGDIGISADSRDRKMAHAAAEAGIGWYASKLAADPDYWQKCDTGVSGGVADPVNQPNVSAAARKWKRLTGTNNTLADKVEFSIGMLPITSVSSTCSTTNPQSMLNPADGSFKIRSTGRYRNSLSTIVTTFTRQRFLNFIYFTDYETLDPAAGNPGGTSCAQYKASRPSNCTVIQFTDKDKVNGPLHTNDSLVTCGTPTFGRDANDAIEVSGPAPGWAANSGCSGSTPAPGAFRSATRSLQMPPTNATLKTLASPANPQAGSVPTSGGYLLTGTQYIRFTNNGSMVVDTPNGNPVSVALPPNGVIYVQNDPGTSGNPVCNDTDNPGSYTYDANASCANVYVSGTVDKSITIASEKDIIVAPTLSTLSTTTANQFNPLSPQATDADLIAGTMTTSSPAGEQVSGSVNVGLIADNFVRVYHPINSSGANQWGPRDVRIDAAILSLQHSFIVDNWNRGAYMGTLTVHGAIAQRFRGPVGTGSGTTPSTGFLKNYTYDNRLRFKSPPYFLDPVNAAWGVGRENELVPPV